MKTFNEDSVSDLIYLFIDGEADLSQQQTLFASLASDSELQTEFQQALDINHGFAADKATLYPPAELTKSVFLSAGFNPPSIPSPVGAESAATSIIAQKTIGFVSFFQKYAAQLLTAVGSSLVTAGVIQFAVIPGVIENTKNETIKLIESKYTGQELSGIVSNPSSVDQALSQANSSIWAKQNEKANVSQKPTVIYKYKYITPGYIARKDYIAGKNEKIKKTNNDDVKYSNHNGNEEVNDGHISNNNHIINNNHISNNNYNNDTDVNNIKDNKKIDSENSNSDNVNLNLVYSDESKNISNSEQTKEKKLTKSSYRVSNKEFSSQPASAMPSFIPSNYNYHYSDMTSGDKTWSLELGGISNFALMQIDNSSASKSFLNNCRFTVRKVLDKNHSVSIQIGSEEFQMYAVNWSNGKPVFQPEPTMFWYGAGYRYTFDEISFLGSIKPFSELVAGGSRYGFMSKCVLGLTYNPENFLSISLGVEGMLQTYMLQNNLNSAGKLGITYQIGIHF